MPAVIKEPRGRVVKCQLLRIQSTAMTCVTLCHLFSLSRPQLFDRKRGAIVEVGTWKSLSSVLLSLSYCGTPGSVFGEYPPLSTFPAFASPCYITVTCLQDRGQEETCRPRQLWNVRETAFSRAGSPGGIPCSSTTPAKEDPEVGSRGGRPLFEEGVLHPEGILWKNLG